jgi:hypothetical protein
VYQFREEEVGFNVLSTTRPEYKTFKNLNFAYIYARPAKSIHASS